MQVFFNKKMRIHSNIFDKPYKLQNRDRPIDLILIQQLANIEHNFAAGITAGLNSGVVAFAYSQSFSRLGLSQPGNRADPRQVTDL